MDEATRIIPSVIYLAVVVYAFLAYRHATTPMRQTKLLILVSIGLLWLVYRIFVIVAFWGDGPTAPWLHDFNAMLGRAMHIPNSVALLLLVDESRQAEKLQRKQIEELKTLQVVELGDQVEKLENL